MSGAGWVAGAGDIYISGGPDRDFLIYSDMTNDLLSSITLNTDADIIVGARVWTTNTAANVTFVADADGDDTGGVWVQAAGEVSSGANVMLSGADVTNTGSRVESVFIDADGVNTQVVAVGNVSLLSTNSAPGNSDIVVDGLVFATSNLLVDALRDVDVNADITGGTSVTIDAGTNLLVSALITGHCGPKAFRVLQAGNVEIYQDAQGTVKESFKAYQNGKMGRLN